MPFLGGRVGLCRVGAARAAGAGNAPGDDRCRGLRCPCVGGDARGGSQGPVGLDFRECGPALSQAIRGFPRMGILEHEGARGRRRRKLPVRLLLSACPLIRRTGRCLSGRTLVRGLGSALRAWTMSYGLTGWNHRLMPPCLDDWRRWLMTKAPVGRSSRPMPVYGRDSV